MPEPLTVHDCPTCGCTLEFDGTCRTVECPEGGSAADLAGSTLAPSTEDEGPW